MHSSPTGAGRPKLSRSKACERTSPAAPPNSAGSPDDVGVAAAAARFGAEQFVDRAGLQQMDAVHGQARAGAAALSTADRHDIDIEQHGEVGGHDLQQLLEARRGEDRQHRLVHPALAREIAAAGRDQGAVLDIEPGQVAAQPLEQEMLEIDHPVADLAARRAQQAQRLGMLRRENRGGGADRR